MVNLKIMDSVSPHKRKQLIIGAALAVSLLIIIFLQTSNSLHIRTAPIDRSQVNIQVDGLLTLAVGDHFLLQDGQFELSASAEGFKDYSETITISDDSNQYHDLSLEPLPGNLLVGSNVDAEVLIDGKALGRSGEIIEGIPAGLHQLTVRAERYRDLNDSLSIEGRNKTQNLKVELSPNWGSLNLDSTPSNAELFIDDQLIGVTPLSTEVLEGKHQIKLQLAGHQDWHYLLRIGAEETIQLPKVQLQVADNLVAIHSSPSGASVTIDGNYRGQTPVQLPLAAGKSYQLTLFKAGFAPQNRSIAIEPGQATPLSFDLSADLGIIDVRAKPADALLYVDGRLMGRANQKVTLTARAHRIEIKKEGFAAYRGQVEPRPGLLQKLAVTLLTDEQHKWKTIARSITTSANQEMLLFRPDDAFIMGASRREQGRRANETQRSVKLTRSFYLSKQLVSNRQFRLFQQHHSSGHVKGKSLNGESYPVVNISWQQAAAYCNWLSEQEKLRPYYLTTGGLITGINASANGYRMPTETEWAWTARLENGGMKKFTWGSQLPPSEGSGNFGDRQAAPLLGNILNNYDDAYSVTSPVGKFPANQRQIYDLAGNAAEWISDFYSIDTGLSLSQKTDPLGPETGDYHVIRGSSWAHATMTDLRLSFRDYGVDARNDLGFRIARFVD